MGRLEEILSTSSIFEQIPQEKYANVIHCLGGTQKRFSRDETIVDIGDFTQLAGIVLSGTVEAAFFDENGNQASVNFLRAGDVFGAERACCSWQPSPTRLRALSDSEVLFLRFGNLLEVKGEQCPYRARVTANLLRDFARQTQFLNLKLRIMGQKHLRDKLKIYLQTLHAEADGVIHIPMNRRELAEFLYADRSALSRELARMREDGILEFDRSRIRVLDAEFLKG